MRELLDDGIEWVERETGIPVLGVVPYVDVNIEAEDSLALSALRFKKPKPGEFSVDVAMIRLPRISNFTDVDPFFDEPEVGVRLIGNVAELGTPDLLIVPGTKSTMDDLAWLKAQGFAQAFASLRARGTKIIGICGGFQMLGEVLLDPEAVEGNGDSAHGLGLLPIETVFVGDKKTVQMSGVRGNDTLTGYEIHLGRTNILRDEVSPFLQLADGRVDGAVSADEQVIGTYFHGLFHNRTFTRQLVNEIRISKGITPLPTDVKSDAERREDAYNMLASHVRANLNMEKIYEMLKFEVHG